MYFCVLFWQVIRDDMAASCFSKSQLKYHLAHALINVVILVAAFVGLIFFFRSERVQNFYFPEAFYAAF